MLDEVANPSISNPKRPEPKQCGVDLNGVTVKWPAADEQEDDTLKEISFRVQPNQVLAVVGHVGSGKVGYSYFTMTMSCITMLDFSDSSVPFVRTRALF